MVKIQGEDILCSELNVKRTCIFERSAKLLEVSLPLLYAFM